MKLGVAIKVARIQKGMRQRALAEKLGVTVNYISLLETDRRDPSWSLVCRIADAVDVSVPDLMRLAPKL